ncbi:MAG: hypothetical protein ISR65_08915 [Bacteriovoracaceae bacterium]|nr:hypothetical protein [Bacteriovoracaceae bacterium]
MSTANIKLSSSLIKELKKLTGEKTGQKAVEKVIHFFQINKKQQDFLKEFENISFQKGFNPLSLRKKDR